MSGLLTCFPADLWRTQQSVDCRRLAGIHTLHGCCHREIPPRLMKNFFARHNVCHSALRCHIPFKSKQFGKTSLRKSKIIIDFLTLLMSKNLSFCLCLPARTKSPHSKKGPKTRNNVPCPFIFLSSDRLQTMIHLFNFSRWCCIILNWNTIKYFLHSWSEMNVSSLDDSLKASKCPWYRNTFVYTTLPHLLQCYGEFIARATKKCSHFPVVIAVLVILTLRSNNHGLDQVPSKYYKPIVNPPPTFW